jgi:hypothetical protein
LRVMRKVVDDRCFVGSFGSGSSVGAGPALARRTGGVYM